MPLSRKPPLGPAHPASPSHTALLTARPRPSPQQAAYGQAPNSSRFSSQSVSSSGVTEKFNLSPDPRSWNSAIAPGIAEDDDYIHNPDPRKRGKDRDWNIFTWRGLVNIGSLAVLFCGILALFAGYPIISHFTQHKQSNNGGFNVGGINASGQIPTFIGGYGLIDPETPQEVRTKKDYVNGNDWQLVFSDEFNTPGRTFWPGDDPYWEAVDLHYWQTGNLEWLDPTAVTTKDGALEITMSEKPKNGLNYTSSMITTWNKFCFQGGMLEVNVSLPGAPNVVGLWPAIWTMGNLGRAGYGASLEGMWPYSYDTCDVGTVKNQSLGGVPDNPATFSWLPGQKLSRCTCPGASHPGPLHDDGTYVGRSAPEIDVFEGSSGGGIGQVSQSAQWAPFDYNHQYQNGSDYIDIADSSITSLNSYTGGSYQEASSGVSNTVQTAWELGGGGYSIYGYQYEYGFDDAYITWVSSGVVSWSLKQSAVGPSDKVDIGQRLVSVEPMYIIINLGISEGFGGFVDVAHLVFPTTLRVDYVRVYQDPNNIKTSCDPPDAPTATYIKAYEPAYTNPNYTDWQTQYGEPFPGNHWAGDC
ncbi:beta-glucan synthesis-associated [Rhodofomes roseus]|uniref:Beta-glucan synthesis-associated n=1 Tax=Rhodofomes roseus TaxID=34475 RepID=A0ABQ8KHP9_9APHY|nr:beta-glucan synthesis-associated [Rhodofomes roseus]KAH9837169.1 beta-glucan synthesis-associated [Rhodofomes roseus]